jgi:hypothetical protein
LLYLLLFINNKFKINKMSKKIMLSEVARFQSIAGLRSLSSLKEDMDMEESMDMDEDSDYMGAETIEDEPVTEGIWDTALGQIGTLVALTGGVAGVGKALMMYAAHKIKKENPGMSDQEVKAKAKAELQHGMESSLGQTKGTGIGGNA